MRWRKLAAAFSLLLIVGSILSLATKQLALGLDFTGGTQVEVYYADAVPLDDIRQTLANQFFIGVYSIFGFCSHSFCNGYCFHESNH